MFAKYAYSGKIRPSKRLYGGNSAESKPTSRTCSEFKTKRGRKVYKRDTVSVKTPPPKKTRSLCSSWSKVFNPPPEAFICESDMFIVYDMETTGQSTLKDEPVQIAWKMYTSDGTDLGGECHLVKPNRRISFYATRVHGIGNLDVQNALDIRSVFDIFKTSVERVAKDHNLTRRFVVGHNITRFDNIMLNRVLSESNAIQELGVSETIDTLRMLKKHSYKGKECMANNQLGYVHSVFVPDHSFDNAHSAMGDVEANARVFFSPTFRSILSSQAFSWRV